MRIITIQVKSRFLIDHVSTCKNFCTISPNKFLHKPSLHGGFAGNQYTCSHGVDYSVTV